MRNAAEMFSLDPNPTRAKNAWASSTCLLYGESTPECELLITTDFHYTNGPLKVLEIGNSNGLKTNMFQQIKKLEDYLEAAPMTYVLTK